MITIDQFRAMQPGTIFYVAAPGVISAIESNTLSEERFIGFVDTPNPAPKLESIGSAGKLHIRLASGGISYDYGKSGKSFFLDKAAAITYMEARHERRHREGLKQRASQVEKLKAEIAQMEANGPGTPDYIFHSRSTNE